MLKYSQLVRYYSRAARGTKNMPAYGALIGALMGGTLGGTTVKGPNAIALGSLIGGGVGYGTGHWFRKRTLNRVSTPVLPYK